MDRRLTVGTGPVRSEDVINKAFRRLLPLCILFYVLSYIDRVNIGVAALTMNKDLGLSAQAFGFAATAFYTMYCLGEVPSNVALAKFGARVWIPRIMVTWGMATVLTMFAKGPVSLALFRALLGAAEAGLLPGLLYLLGHWFPQGYRARANALFLTSQPLALLIGAPLSGALLQLNGIWGLKGWQWLFVVEGLPPIAVGVAVYFLLPNGPQDARWLDSQEKAALIARLREEESPSKEDGEKLAMREVLGHPMILTLGLIYFCVGTTLGTFSVWMPLIIKDVLGPHSGSLIVALVTAIPPAFAIPVMTWVSIRSDRDRNRFGLLVVSMSVSAAGWGVLALAAQPTLKLAGMTLCYAGIYAALPIFFATIGQLFQGRRHAVAIAAVSALGGVSAIVGPSIIGYLRDVTHSFNASIWYAVALLLIGVGALRLVALMQLRKQLA